MKNIAILLFLTLSSIASAANYYISPSGNDSNNGTIDSPFFTLNKAWSVARAGDVIYARGGIYRFNSRQNLTGKSGTSSDTIRIEAYDGERPVFTKSSSFTASSWPVCLIYLSADYVHLKGLEVSYFTQQTSTIWYGIAACGANHNKFEEINSHHNGHGMVVRDESSHNLILNCDFHHNYDPLTSGDAYGNADGLEVGYQSGSVENTIKGCRVYNNSDDGVDLWNNNGNVIIDGCWSWNNGFREDLRTTGGDGGGFKFGATTTATGSEFKRTVKNCISVYNRTKGFNQNGAKVKFYFYNNIAYKNPQGVVFYTDNLANVYKNNICFGNSSNWVGDYSNSVKDHNSYDPVLSPSGPTVSNSDFISVDTTGISRKRQADGSLPNINFLKLASGSRMIDAGTNVGTSYSGSAPDLGPFESGKAVTSVPPATDNLSYVSSLIKSATPSEIEITYNHPIGGAVPSTSCFEIKVNSVTRTISKLSYSDKFVYLTLSSPVQKDETVTLSYNKPATNPLQCSAGTLAESISAKAVTNSIGATGPLYVSATVENSSPDKIELTYDVKLANVLPATSSFFPKVNGTNRSVKSVTITENKVTLTLTAGLTKTDTIYIAYTKPATNPLQTTTGGKAESITDKPVVNNIIGVATGSNNVINDGKISIFPNPAKDYIRIANFDPGEQEPILRIFDFSGKLCQEIKLRDMPKMMKIPINLKSGMYIAQMMIGTIVNHVQKLIVVK